MDGISHDKSRAISVIGFIGSVFSPWYAWSGRRDPANHCCINVATYGPGGRFAMTDRGRHALRQSSDTLRIGPSSMRWHNGVLSIELDEKGALPRLGRIKGRVTVTPLTVTGVEMPLTPDGAHIWRPFGPSAKIDVCLDAEGWQWQGDGYFDANFGTRALEQDFDSWSWARFPTRGGAACFYQAERVDGTSLRAGVHFDGQGIAQVIEVPKARLGRSLWGLERSTWCDTGSDPEAVMGLLDAPFYDRSMVRTRIDGNLVTGVHETLDLRRFRSRVIKAMLAVRVPRRAGWKVS